MKSPLVEDDWDIKFAYGIKKQQKTHTTCLLVKCFHCRLAAIYVSSSLVFWQYFKNTCKASHVLQTFLQPHTSSPKSMKHEQQPLVYILFQPISPPPKKKYSSKAFGALLQAICKCWIFFPNKPIHLGHHTYLGCMKPVDAICDLGSPWILGNVLVPLDTLEIDVCLDISRRYS